MKQRYNIALLPLAKGEEFIAYSHGLSEIAGPYQLGPASLPHVTLCQFMAEESTLAELWKRFCDSGIQQSIELTLEEIQNKIIEDKSWVSLLPDKPDALMQMHCQAAELVDERLGRCFEDYEAHLTLANIRLEKQDSLRPIITALQYRPIQDRFSLSLGEADDYGQFKRLLYSCQAI